MEEKKNGFANDAGTNNNVGVIDDLGMDIIAEQIKNYKAEKEQYEQALLEIDKSKENYQKQWAIDKEIMALQLEHFGKNEKDFTHKIHYLPRYWELEKEKYSFNVHSETIKAEQQMKGYDAEKEKVSQRIIEINEQVARLEKE